MLALFSNTAMNIQILLWNISTLWIQLPAVVLGFEPKSDQLENLPFTVSTKKSLPLQIKTVNSNKNVAYKFKFCCILIGRKIAASNFNDDLLPFLERRNVK